jgi:hypothetical protein
MFAHNLNQVLQQITATVRSPMEITFFLFFSSSSEFKNTFSAQALNLKTLFSSSFES